MPWSWTHAPGPSRAKVWLWWRQGGAPGVGEAVEGSSLGGRGAPLPLSLRTERKHEEKMRCLAQPWRPEQGGVWTRLPELRGARTRLRAPRVPPGGMGHRRLKQRVAQGPPGLHRSPLAPSPPPGAGQLPLGSSGHDPSPAPRGDHRTRPTCGGGGRGGCRKATTENCGPRTAPGLRSLSLYSAPTPCAHGLSQGARQGAGTHAEEASPRPRRPLQAQSWGPGQGPGPPRPSARRLSPSPV